MAVRGTAQRSAALLSDALATQNVAAEYPNVRFLRINGNENRSCTALARDVLGIRRVSC